MTLYSFDEIKTKGNCAEYAENVLAMKRVGNSNGWLRFNCPWRPDSDSGAFSVNTMGWIDQVTKETGSIIDLVMRVRNVGLMEAQSELGEYYQLTPQSVRESEAPKIVKTYDYTDVSGNVLFQVVRWFPKRFTQRRPDPEKSGEWINDLKGVERVLYRMDRWIDDTSSVIVEGEKDADALLEMGFPATTNSGGAGNWLDSYNTMFTDRSVIIIPDNDEPGRDHATLVAGKLRPYAKSVRILELPGLPAKGDVSDWFAMGRTKEELIALMDRPSAVVKPVETEADIVAAKKANETPFRNYAFESVRVSEDAEPKIVKVPLSIGDLVKEIKTRFLNFPCRIGSTLFDHDRDTGEIRFIPTPSALISWIGEKSKQACFFGKLEGAVSADHLFWGVLANARRYEMVSACPHWPLREDVYYTYRALPPADRSATAFNQLLSFFCPATKEDEIMLRAFFASPLYFRPKVERPIWVVDAATGQGTGKSKLAEFLAYLYGDGESGEPMRIDFKQMNSEQSMTVIQKRLLSPTGRQKRIVLLDNIDGYYRSSALASMTTDSGITGMAPYGHGEETRPNDVTLVLTVNSGTFHSDLITRSVFVTIKRPEINNPSWQRDVQDFIQKNRLQILSDIIALLEKGRSFNLPPMTRAKLWDQEVLQALCTDEEYKLVVTTNSNRGEQADGEQEEADMIRDCFTRHIKANGLDPDQSVAWIQLPAVVTWCREAIPDWQRVGERSITHFVRNMLKNNLIRELSFDPGMKYPARGEARQRGFGWNWEFYSPTNMATPVTIFRRESEGAVGIQRF